SFRWMGPTSSYLVVQCRPRHRLVSHQQHLVAFRSAAGPSTHQVTRESRPALLQPVRCRTSIHVHWRSARSKSFHYQQSRSKPTPIPDESTSTRGSGCPATTGAFSHTPRLSTPAIGSVVCWTGSRTAAPSTTRSRSWSISHQSTTTGPL